ncbi:phage tail spike protein [Bacillus sp. JJ1533]|uniref:phage tail spike protein n=1 Tax=Bacillus sp. JJ1533 TaxID=3122959 RepID=UPI002FFF3562
MKELFIFNKDEELLTVLKPDDQSTVDTEWLVSLLGEYYYAWETNFLSKGNLSYYDAKHTEQINNVNHFEFEVPANHPDSQFIIEENMVAFIDDDGEMRLFVIKELDEIHNDDLYKIVYCQAAWIAELSGSPLEDLRPQNKTALEVLTTILENTRWSAGKVGELGLFSTNFYFENVVSAIKKILTIWGGEIKDRIVVTDGKISGRYIDILMRRGSDTGKSFEIGKDIKSVTKRVLSNPVSAIYGRGKSLPTDEGGFTRKTNFEDVSWIKANGDPVDKPLGQKWVGDEEVRQRIGKLKDGERQHVYAFIDYPEIDDPETLLEVTWNNLQKKKYPIVEYTLKVIDLASIIGLDHEKVRLGDTVFISDKEFTPELFIEARIIEIKKYINEPERNEVVLGDFISLFTDDDRLDEIESKLNDKGGVWDKGAEPIDDSDYPDIVPPTPTNFTAEGYFKAIALKWDYALSSYIAAYELYASQIKGFVPDKSNLTYRGKTGGYVFNADTDQQWYFRARTINHHGTPSPFTVEVQANTQRILTDDMVFGEEMAAKLRDLSKTAQLLADGSITGDMEMVNGQLLVREAAIGTAAIANGVIENFHLGEGIIDFAQIKKAIITDELISPLAKIDFAKIANVEITDAHISGRLKANRIEVGPDTVYEDGYDPTKIEVGGRNLVRNGDFSNALTHWRNWQSNRGTRELIDITDLPGFLKGFKIVANTSNEWGYAQDSLPTIQGEPYILSAWVKIESGGIELQEGNGSVSYSQTTSQVIGKWHRVEHQFIARDNFTNIYLGQTNSASNTIAYFTGVQLEKGNKATEWTPAPEDIQQYTDNKVDPYVETWNKADIINQSSSFEWTPEGFVAINPSNTLERVKFTSGGVGISSDGGKTYKTAITGSGVYTQRLQSYGSNTYMEIEGSDFYVRSNNSTRKLFDAYSTLTELYDGNEVDPAILGYGKIYMQRVEIYVPSGSYKAGGLSSEGGYIEKTINITDYVRVALSERAVIIPQSIHREFYAYEVLGGRVMGGDLEKIKLRISPYYNVNVGSAFYAQIDLLIVGWR